KANSEDCLRVVVALKAAYILARYPSHNAVAGTSGRTSSVFIMNETDVLSSATAIHATRSPPHIRASTQVSARPTPANIMLARRAMKMNATAVSGFCSTGYQRYRGASISQNPGV